MRSNLRIGMASAGAPPKGIGPDAGRRSLPPLRKTGDLLLAVAVMIVWGVAARVSALATQWQLVINPGTTIVTFLVAFLIQAAQNRGTLALQLKLDKRIVATSNARNEIAGSKKFPDEQIEKANQR